MNRFIEFILRVYEGLNRRKFFFFILFTLYTLHLTLSFVSAESFKILGSRPLGMGGAFVAVAEDGLAQYWNPAGLAGQKLFDLQLPVNLNTEFSGEVLNFVDDLKGLAEDYKDIQLAQGAGGKMNLKQINAFFKAIKTLDDLNKPGNGFLFDLYGGGSARFGALAFFINNFTSVGADPSVDVQNIGLGKGAPSFGAPKFAGYSVGISSGIDLSKLITELGANTAEPTDTQLSTASYKLETIITTLADKLGAELGGYTVDQIANALIDYSVNQSSMPIDVVIATVDDIKEIESLVTNIMVNASTTGYNTNKSALTLKGASVVEIGVSYGRLFPLVQGIPLLKGLKVGANVKYIGGVVGFLKQNLLVGEAETGAIGISKDFKKNSKTSTAIGVDLGLLWDKQRMYRTRVGLLARNINAPKLKQPDVVINDPNLRAREGDYYKLDPQLRLGVAFWPTRSWLIAADFDLSKNKTQIEGFESQLLGLGTELNLVDRPWFNLALRVGLMKNLALSGSELTYTGGLGLNILHFVLDLSGAVTPSEVQVAGGGKLPSSVTGALTLSMNF